MAHHGDSLWLSFDPPVPGGFGTAQVGTPSRGSSQTCSSHQTAKTAMNVNALSISALFQNRDLLSCWRDARPPGKVTEDCPIPRCALDDAGLSSPIAGSRWPHSARRQALLLTAVVH